MPGLRSGHAAPLAAGPRSLAFSSGQLEPGPPRGSVSSRVTAPSFLLPHQPLALGRKAVTLALQRGRQRSSLSWGPSPGRVLAGEGVPAAEIKGRTWSTIDHSFFLFLMT